MKRSLLLLIAVVGLCMFAPSAPAATGQAPSCADVTGDGVVRVSDILAVVSNYSSRDPIALSRYDLTHDGVITVADILAVVRQYGKACPERIDAQAMSDAVTAAEAMETCATDNNGDYSTVNCNRAGLIAIEPSLAAVAARLTVTPLTTGYRIEVVSNRDGGAVTFRLDRAANGVSTRTCTVAGGVDRGLCAEDGSWGTQSPWPHGGVGDAAAKSAVVTAAEAMETCATDNNGSYATCDEADLVAIEPTLSGPPAVVVVFASSGSYTLTTTSTTGTMFTLARASSGTTARTCTPAGSGGCSASGTW